MTSLAGIAEWVRLRAGWLNQVLPNPYQSFPCAATYSNVLRALDAQQVRQVLNDLLTRVGAMKREREQVHAGAGAVEEGVQDHVALDGKTLRGTLGLRRLISSRRIINPPWLTTCASFSPSHRTTAKIGAPHVPSTKDMDGWKSAN